MLATPATPRTDVFNDDNWVTELKMDGRRVIIDIAAGDHFVAEFAGLGSVTLDFT